MLRLNSLLCVSTFIFMCFSLVSRANDDYVVPQFNNYTVAVSHGPFAKKVVLVEKQQQFSEHWKQLMQEQLLKPVNFAGHYRLYTGYGGYGKECLRDNWVCGWVIDKLTGKVVSELPYSADGVNNIYADIGDNNTPVGEHFNAEAYKNSSLLALTAQAIPKTIKHDKDGIPISSPCETVYYDFKAGNFNTLFEDKSGCSVENND